MTTWKVYKRSAVKQLRIALLAPLALCAALVTAGAANAALPSEYVRIASIGSTGSQYIRTGMMPTSSTTVEMDFNTGSYTASTVFFGQDYAISQFLFAKQKGGYVFYGSGGMVSDVMDNTDAHLSITSEGKLILDYGTTAVTTSVSRTASSSNGFNIFADCNGNHKGSWTLYSMQISTGGVLVRDFVPAKRLSDSVGGLFDKVENKFYTNAGTGSFKMGEIVVDEPPDYITTIPVTDAEDRNYPTGGSKSGVAPLVLTGANDWGGTFTVNEGALIADFGQGLASTDNLVFNGGTYGLHTGSTFNWTIGSGGGETSFGVDATNCGFTAYGNAFSVVANGNAATPIEFGTASSTGFNPAKFTLNDNWATDTVTFKNGITGNNGDASKPALHIYSGAADAVVEGNVTGVDLYKEGSGRLSLRGANNSFAGIYPRGGTLVIAPPEGDSSCALALTTINNSTTSGANLVISNAVITQSGNSDQSWRGGTSVSLVGCSWTSNSQWWPGSSKGTGGKASFVLDGSNVSVGNNYTCKLGLTRTDANACVCDMTVTNGANFTTGQLYMQNGFLHQYSGKVKVTYGADLRLAASSGCTFTNYIHGGSLEVGSSFRIGWSDWDKAACRGTLYIYPGGTFTAGGGQGVLGGNTLDTGRLDVCGGTATMTKDGFLLKVATSGTGLCNVSDNGLLDLQKGYADVGEKGTVSITDGGTVKTRAIRGIVASGTPTIVLDGGKVVANTGSTTNDLVYGFASASVGIGGIEIDTNGQDKEISQGFAARSGQSAPTATTAAELAVLPAFTKTGEGTLSLTGANDWLCATCVSNGTLAVASGALPATTLRLGGGVIDLGGASHTVANLVGSGVVSNGTLTVTGTVWPGVGDSGTLKIDSTATLNLSTLGCSVAEGGLCGCLEVAGTQNLAGVTVVGEGMENKVSKRGLTLVRAASLVGSPTADASLLHNNISVSGGSLRIGAPPFILIVR